MTRADFERLSRRVLSAFDQKPDAPLEIEHRSSKNLPDGTPDESAPSHNFNLKLQMHSHPLTLLFFHSSAPRSALFSISLIGQSTPPELIQFSHNTHPLNTHTPDTIYKMIRLHCPETYAHLLLRALLRLGYDLDSLSPELERNSITLTNHEKLEWQLETRKNPH